MKRIILLLALAGACSAQTIPSIPGVFSLSSTSSGGGSGTVTSVSFTGGLISVANPTTTPAFTVAGTSGGIPYFSSTSTWASSSLLAANSLMVGGGVGAAPSTTTTGTGVLTALGVNTGSAGAFVVNGGALGTPSSGTVTNLTGTASININGTVGATTPAAGTFSALTDTANTFTIGSTARTVVTGAGSPEGVITASIGALYMRNDGGSGTTLYSKTSGTGNTGWSAVGASTITGSDTQVMFFDGANTPAGDAGMTYNKTTDSLTLAGTLTTGSGASTAGAVALTQGTTQSTGTTNITIQAPAAVTPYIATLPGTVGTNGAFWTQTTSGSTATVSNSKVVPTGTVLGDTDTQTLTNKRVTARITTITSSATPTVNTDNCDCVTITALAAAITSMTTNLTGTPVNFDQLEYRIKDDGTARAITWGASFASGTGTLPTTTTISKVLHAWFEWDSVQSKWICASAGSEP